MENPESVVSPLPSYQLLLKCPSGLSPDQVFMDFNPSYDRNPHPDTSLENSISETWNKRIQETPSLFNGTKFRYGGYALHSVDGSNQKPNVCLHLGLTDYRTFMGTNLSTEWEKFMVHSEDDSIKCQHTSSPLGNGAVVETADKKIVVLQRSNNVGEFPGHFVFPGGHPEPQEIGILSHGYDQDLTDSEQINKKVSQEMFDSIIREVVEEIGVPAHYLEHRWTTFGSSRHGDDIHEVLYLVFNNQSADADVLSSIWLVSEQFNPSACSGKTPVLVYAENSMLCKLSDPILIGISRREMNVRPAAFFFLKCSLDSNEIQQLYSNAQDSYESVQIYTVSRSDLKEIATKMPGCHRGGWALYELMVE